MSIVEPSPGPIEHTVQVGGSDLHYWTYGTDPAAQRSEDETPLVMIHGLRGTHHGLELIAGHVPGRPVVVPDLPGFGDSGPMQDRCHDVEGYARLVIELVERLGGRDRPVLLLGHSFGSLIAAHAASVAPELVQRLILVNPISTPALRGPRAVLSRLTSVYYRLGRALPPRLGRRLLSNRGIVLAVSRAMVRTRDTQLRRFVHDSHLRYFSRFHSPALLAESYDASVTHTVADYAATLTMHTLLIAGATDDIAPVRGQRRLMAELADAELVVLPEVGHLVHYETPMAAAQAIQRFLAAP